MSKANPEIYVAIEPETEETYLRGTEAQRRKQARKSERERERVRVCTRAVGAIHLGIRFVHPGRAGSMRREGLRDHNDTAASGRDRVGHPHRRA